MRFIEIELKDFGPFGHRRIRFDELDGKLTAITGDNGAGKSTLLELLLGAVYRDCPTRGPLIGLATSREAFLRVDLEAGGHSYTFQHHVDAVSRKSDVLLIRDGEKSKSTKVSMMDAVVAKQLPSRDILLVTQFAAQKSQGFLDTKPAERKSLLLRIQGVDKLEALAASAREELNDARKAVDERRAALDAMAAAEDTAALQRELDGANEALEAAQRRYRQSQESLAAARVESEAAKRSQQALKDWVSKRDEIGWHRSRCTERIQNLQRQVDVARRALSAADQIRTAVTRVEARRQEVEGIAQDVLKLDGRLSAARQRHAEAERRLPQLQQVIRENERILQAKAAVEDAVRWLPGVDQTIVSASAQMEEIRPRMNELAAKQVAGLDSRLAAALSALGAILHLNQIETARNVANKALAEDEKAAEAAIALPRQRKEVSDAFDRASDQHVKMTVRRVELSKLAARAEVMAQAEQLLASAQAEVTTVAEQQRAAEAQILELEAERRERLTRQQEGIRDVNDLKARAAEAPALDRAEATLKALDPELRTSREEEQRLQAEREALGPEPDTLPTPQLPTLETAAHAAQRAVTDAAAKPGVLEHRLAQAEVNREKRRAAESSIVALEQEVADWRRLAADLGKDGLQAALSDALLPELVALTNTLLHSAFGPRFTVDVRSQKADASGKRLLETLDVIVIDTQRGREDLAEALSGGEEVIIAEGISLALTILACRSAGSERPTLVRDEAGAALSVTNGRAWIAMLRRAVEIVGADRLLFVSHSKEIAALADSRIEL